MIDLSRVAGYEWDAGNVRKSVDKHRVIQSVAEQVFVNSRLIVVPDVAHNISETRFQALGKTNNMRLLHIAFTFRRAGTLIRVISARDTSRKETIIHAQSS